MEREEFYKRFTELLRELSPGVDLTDLRPDTHVWSDGYVDSMAMLDVIMFVEDLTGHELAVDGDFLPTFFTMELIYDRYIAPAAGPATAR